MGGPGDVCQRALEQCPCMCLIRSGVGGPERDEMDWVQDIECGGGADWRAYVMLMGNFPEGAR